MAPPPRTAHAPVESTPVEGSTSHAPSHTAPTTSAWLDAPTNDNEPPPPSGADEPDTPRAPMSTDDVSAAMTAFAGLLDWPSESDTIGARSADDDVAAHTADTTDHHSDGAAPHMLRTFVMTAFDNSFADLAGQRGITIDDWGAERKRFGAWAFAGPATLSPAAAALGLPEVWARDPIPAAPFGEPDAAASWDRVPRILMDGYLAQRTSHGRALRTVVDTAASYVHGRVPDTVSGADMAAVPVIEPVWSLENERGGVDAAAYAAVDPETILTDDALTLCCVAPGRSSAPDLVGVSFHKLGHAEVVELEAGSETWNGDTFTVHATADNAGPTAFIGALRVNGRVTATKALPLHVYATNEHHGDRLGDRGTTIQAWSSKALEYVTMASQNYKSAYHEHVGALDKANSGTSLAKQLLWTAITAAIGSAAAKSIELIAGGAMKDIGKDVGKKLAQRAVPESAPLRSNAIDPLDWFLEHSAELYREENRLHMETLQLSEQRRDREREASDKSELLYDFDPVHAMDSQVLEPLNSATMPSVDDFERELWRLWINEFAWSAGNRRVTNCGADERAAQSQPYCEVTFEPVSNVASPIRDRLRIVLGGSQQQPQLPDDFVEREGAASHARAAMEAKERSGRRATGSSRDK